jgi:hypothetical protein
LVSELAAAAGGPVFVLLEMRLMSEPKLQYSKNLTARLLLA